MKTKQIVKKVLSVVVMLLFAVILLNVAIIGVAELQTFYYHLLFILLWILTAGIGIKAYSIWELSKYVAEGEDKQLNQAERAAIIKAHSAIIIASAILVFGTVLVYYGKAASTVGQGLGN